MARNIQAEAAGDMPVDEQPTVEPAQPEPSPLAFWRYITCRSPSMRATSSSTMGRPPMMGAGSSTPAR